MTDYEKLADEFYSVIAHASCGTDFDDIPMAVRGCIEEVKKLLEKDCKTCINWEPKAEVHATECYDCKRYWADKFEERK